MITTRQAPCILLAAVFGLGVAACSSDNNQTTDRGPGRPDASPRPDAMPLDAAGQPDSGQVIDTGFPDTGQPDSGMPDTGMNDTGTGPTDARPDSGPDTGMPDIGRPDMGPRDTGMPDTGMFDAGPAPECVTPQLTVLTRTGSVTLFTGDNRSAPTISGLPNPSCTSGTGAARVFQYTPGTTSILRVSTNYPRTNFDTVAWALDRCLTAGGMELGCNDDSQMPPHRLASTFRTTTERPMGTPLYIVVAGFSMAVGTATVGDFELHINELVRRAPGQVCDSSPDPLDYCPSGSFCVQTSTRTGAPFNCVADGARNGRCRTTGTPCDAMLGCSARMRCVPTVGAGMACDPMRVRNVCAAPNQCITMGMMSTCQAAEYTESSIANPTWIDACAAGIHVDLQQDRDDGHSLAAQTIPFSFTFYGMAYTQVWPVADGYAVFGPTAPTTNTAAQYGGQIPNATLGAMIAPFYEDLNLRAAPGSDICMATTGTMPNRTTVIEWLDATVYVDATCCDDTHITAEAILHEGSNVVDYLFNRLEPGMAPMEWGTGAHASIGIQSPAGTRNARHMGAVNTMTGVRFTPR